VAVAVVTGASRGIGRATALALAQKGFTVAVIARAPDELEETRELVARQGGAAVAVAGDVTDPRVVREAVIEIEKRGGPIAALVNNAGTLLAIGPLWEVRPEDWWTDVRTSLGGAFTCCREIVPGMVARGEGRIVNLVSYAAVRPAPYQAGYAAAKAGVVSLTEALAASLEPHGVKAFAVAPGFTRTEMTRSLLESDAGRRWLPEAGRGGEVAAEQTARLIARLASGAADELTGRVLHTLDDLDDLLVRIEEIRRGDLYVPRLRRLLEEGS